MTLIFGKQSVNPVACACCAKPAAAVGQVDFYYKKTPMWVCLECVSISKKVFNMSKTEQERIEMIAIHDGVKSILMPCICASLAAVYKHGLSDLSLVDDVALDAILERAALDGEFNDIQRKFMVHYSRSLNMQLWGNKDDKTPF